MSDLPWRLLREGNKSLIWQCFVESEMGHRGGFGETVTVTIGWWTVFPRQTQVSQPYSILVNRLAMMRILWNGLTLHGTFFSEDETVVISPWYTFIVGRDWNPEFPIFFKAPSRSNEESDATSTWLNVSVHEQLVSLGTYLHTSFPNQIFRREQAH